MKTPQKILVDGPAWIGDMVMAQSLFKLLKQQYPDACIDVLAPQWTAPLLSCMPEINQQIILPFKHGELRWRQRYDFAKTLRHHHYDWAILLRNSFKSALIPFWAKIPQRTGWLGEWRFGLLNDWRTLDKTHYPLMIERFMALAYPAKTALQKPYPLPQLKLDADAVNDSLQTFQLDTKRPIAALCPGAEYGPAKRWPAEHFAKVAQEKLAKGWQVWLMGSANDKTINDKINALCQQRCLNLAGRTNLAQAIHLLSLSRVVITNDSGLMHIAAALDRPLVVLYGSSSPTFTPPLSEKVKILSLALSCSPCFKRTCPLGHTNCLKQLLPTEVLQASYHLCENNA